MTSQAVPIRGIDVIHRNANHVRCHEKKAQLAKFRAMFRRSER